MASKWDIRFLWDRLNQVSLDFTTLSKYSWILHLFIVFLLGKSLSNLFVNYMDYKMQAPKPIAAPKTLPLPQEKPYPAKEEFNVIVKRNIFNPAAPEELEPLIPKGAGAFEEAGALPTTLPIDLTGTIILSDSHKSVAALKEKTANQTESYQVGDIVLGKAKVFKIEAYKVYLQNLDTQTLEFVEKKIEDTLTPSSDEGIISTGEGIRESGEGRFVIDRGALESSIANPNEILTQARAVPNIVDGKIKGFRILSIKPGSVYEKLGIRNGDVVEEVNGVALDSPAKALEFYGAISSASDITLSIERDGQKKVFSYVIK